MRKIFRNYTRLGILILASVIIISIAYLYSNEKLQGTKPNIVQKVSETENSSVFPSTVMTTVNLDEIKREIRDEVAKLDPARRLEIGLIAASPVDNSIIAYSWDVLGYNKTTGYGYGISLFNRKNKVLKDAYLFNGYRSGRESDELDTAEIEFSPTGEAFFINLTGNNAPSLSIISSKGELLYQSEPNIKGLGMWGHSTWLSGKDILYLASEAGEELKSPLILDITTKKTGPSNLPAGIFHFKANSSGNLLLALTKPRTELNCPSYDLVFYRLPTGSRVKIIQNVLLANWIDKSTVKYEKVTGCIRETGLDYSRSRWKESPRIELRKETFPL